MKKAKSRSTAEELSIQDFKDPVLFCEKVLGFKPTQYQVEFLKDDRQFIVLRWCRQSGKSYIVAAYLLWYAFTHPHSHTAVISPSFRQSKRIITKITAFLAKLPKAFGRCLKTRIYLANGSIIEAFPNNPDTIRGPTLDLIYWDEVNFTRDDEDLYDAILFTLGTTNGRFIGSSTPWSRDSIFYRMCFDKDFEDFGRHHVTYEKAKEPSGPLKEEILQKIKKQLASDPWRWQREMEAEFAEDEDAYLSQALITSCIDPNLEYYEEQDLIPNV